MGTNTSSPYKRASSDFGVLFLGSVSCLQISSTFCFYGDTLELANLSKTSYSFPIPELFPLRHLAIQPRLPGIWTLGLYSGTQGIPFLVNVLCWKACLVKILSQRHVIFSSMVQTFNGLSYINLIAVKFLLLSPVRSPHLRQGEKQNGQWPLRASPVAQMVKNPLSMQETLV